MSKTTRGIKVGIFAAGTALLVPALATHSGPPTASAEVTQDENQSPTHPAIDYTTVFSRDQDGYNTFRIPAIVRSNNGTLLAFAEGRVESPSDRGNIDIVLKRSHDGGETWGPLQVVDDNGEDKSGNPVPIVDRSTGRIILNITHTNADGSRRSLIQYSDDDGASWSTPTDITQQVKPPNWQNLTNGPGHGIQLEHGPHAGRLVIAGRHAGVDPSSSGGHAIYSDDGGATWQLGAVDNAPSGVVQPNETTLTELPDGGIYFNTRNQKQSPPWRADTTSSDGGASFDRPYQPIPEIVSARVAASMTTVTYRGRDRLVFSSPGAYGRERLTLLSSLDNGASWQGGLLVYDGPAAYSDLVQLEPPRRALGVLYENGDRVPVDSRLTWSQRITFARVPLGLLNSRPAPPRLTPDVGPGDHDAVVSGDPDPVPGPFGGGFGLSGDYLEVPQTPALDFGRDPFTVAAWFRTSSDSRQVIITGLKWRIRLEKTPRLGARVTDGTTTQSVTSDGNYADGDWHHVALVRDNDQIDLYVDGRLADSTGPVNGSVSDSLRGTRVGARIDGVIDPLLGAVDEVWLFDQALTSQAVQQLVTANQGSDHATVLHLPLEKLK